jgi:GNAT superfamily N-acetyltransferase
MADCEVAEVVRGVDPSAAPRVAELVQIAFGDELAGLALPRDSDAAVVLFAASVSLDEVYAALDPDGRVLGVALVAGRAPILHPTRAALAAAFGSVGGSVRYALFRLLGTWERYPKSTRGLEWFSVDPACRGTGVGSAIVERIIADARAEGVRAIKLDAGDTNPARHLYERFGFVQTRTVPVWPFTRRLGFRRFVFYRLEL